ncbi:hypothetical protein PR202_ga25576 [Eleusine coracana subsp. coracana]|uniref:tRNA pseudouridine synthase n=1 Tax=Eleusine coracana subsp. coracana TaxID=191504 RepID=A0AAV5DC98_ELECO|nr:hypothetical protein PR202_ga25576 [Eleusine coracana subsp. coracana]
MAAADGEASALRAEVAALQLRVQELERENQRLAKIASSCTCGSKCYGIPEGNDLPDDSRKRTRKGHEKGNVSHCSKRLVALKVMYFGQRFYGFSSEGQAEPTVEVISLYLRSNIKDVGGDGLHERSEIDYVKVLNRILPRDIRVLGWCPVPADFHARFTCLGREYKYLFWKGDLDIVDMQKAASKFIGEHDFRNFCKMDAANIVDSLLDITRTPRKPQYKMAPEVPLILRSCVFDNANFMCSSGMS